MAPSASAEFSLQRMLLWVEEKITVNVFLSRYLAELSSSVAILAS